MTKGLVTACRRPRRWRPLLAAAGVALAACTSRVELLSEVQEAEANEALAALSNAGIRAQKVPGKEGAVKLVVDSASVAKAIGVLQEEGLPRERHATMGDVFRKEGMISSPLEERARYLWALSQELSATVAQIDGVLKARVHVVLPERSVGGDAPVPSSAAVFIKHQRGYNLQGSVPQIRQLVSNSIPGLGADKVSVILVRAQQAPNAEPAAAPAAQAPASRPGGPARSSPWLWGGAAALLLGLLGFAMLGLSLQRSRRAAPAPAPSAVPVPPPAAEKAA